MSRALVLFALVAGLPAWAGFDLVTQDLAVDLVTNPATLDVKASLRVRADAPLSAVELVLPSGAISAVTVDGAPAQYTADALQYLLTVQLPAPLAANGEAVIEVAFSGAPSCSSAGRIECARSAAFTFVLPISQQVRWYLISYTATDPFTGKVTFRLPAGHRAALVQGALPAVASQPDGTEQWSFDYATPTDSLAFTAGDSSSVASSDGRFVGFYRDPATKQTMETVIADAVRYYPVMAAMYGPLPGERFHFSFVPLNFIAGGIGTLDLVFLNEILNVPQYSYIIPQAQHELAHSWWGNLSSPSTPFLSEAMAEYTLWRVKGDVDGEREGARGRRMNAVWYLYGRPANQDVALIASNVTSSPVYVQVVYHKGPVVIRTLEELAGKAQLTAGLKEALKVQPTLTPADWLGAIQTASGVDLTRFRDRWLMATGFPKLAVTPAIEAQAGGWKVTLGVTMTGDFPMSLPVVVRLDDGTEQRASVMLDLATTTWTQTFTSRPVSIELDREWTAVRELSPAMTADVTFDGDVDGADLLELAIHLGGQVPSERRVDGSYDPLFDLDHNRAIDLTDIDAVLVEANR